MRSWVSFDELLRQEQDEVFYVSAHYLIILGFDKLQAYRQPLIRAGRALLQCSSRQKQ